MRHNVRFDQPGRINAPEFVERLAAFGASTLLSVQYDQILRSQLLGTVGCPCLNLHFALLPRHRGVAPIAWALIEGDEETGVTLHHMIEDIDAGDIVAQRPVRIDPEDTGRELYDKLTWAAVELFRECDPFPDDLVRTRVAQDRSVASYHRKGDLEFSKPTVDWNRPAAELQRWIRAMIFPPMHYPQTSLGGRPRWITRVAGTLGDSGGAPAGSVVGRSPRGIDVATADRALQILGLTDREEPDEAADDLPQTVAIGDRFA